MNIFEAILIMGILVACFAIPIMILYYEYKK